MGKTFISFILLALVVILISFVSAQDNTTIGTSGPVGLGGGTVKNNETNNTILSIDPEIYGAFNESEWVSVIVRLEDKSGINVTGTKQERRELLRQRDEWFKPVIDEVLAILNENEFKLQAKLSTGFGGEITREGFDKLVNNSVVERIIWPKVGASISLDDNNKSLENGTIKEGLKEETKIEEKESSLWLSGYNYCFCDYCDYNLIYYL